MSGQPVMSSAARPERRRWVAVPASALLLALASGCAAQPAAPAGPKGAALAVDAPSEAPSVKARLSTATPVTGPDAAAIANRLAAELPMGARLVYTAPSDPTGNLDQPGMYASKAAWADPRINAKLVSDREPGAVDLGGSIEVFRTAADAEHAATLTQTVIQEEGRPAGSERDFRSDNVVVSVSGALTEVQARAYAGALGRITHSPVEVVRPGPSSLLLG